ncbi:hypothetical protein ACOSP7_016382 [Xanthoceras sorbifolium]
MRTKEERNYYSRHEKQFLLLIDIKEGQVNRSVQRLYSFFTLPKALFEKLGAGRSEPCAKLHAFSFISRPEPPLMKQVLLVTRLRLRPLMPMKQVFEQSFGKIWRAVFSWFFTKGRGFALRLKKRKREKKKERRRRMQKKKQREDMETEDQELDIRKIMKDIEFLGSSHMTWKERKELENKRIVSLGGKATKKQRIPLKTEGKRTENATIDGNSWTIWSKVCWSQLTNREAKA